MAKDKQTTPTEPIDIFQAMAVDLVAEKEGVWVNDFPVKGLDIKIARANNDQFQQVYAELLEAVDERATKEGRDKTEDETLEVLTRAMSRTLIMGWRQGGQATLRFKGEDLEYSEANAYRVLSDPEMRDFRDRVWQRTHTFDLFKKHREELDRGN